MTMPRQQGEPPFEIDEQLYRRLYQGWVGPGGRVRDAAIDLQGTSVDRSLFAGEASQWLALTDADVVALGAITFGELPSEFNAPRATSYETVVVYKPEHGNKAHSEIQFWRVGESEPSKPSSNPIKAQIREQLVARFRVLPRVDTPVIDSSPRVEAASRPEPDANDAG